MSLGSSSFGSVALGAEEGDQTATIGTLGDFVEIADWSAYVKGLGTLYSNQIGQLIDDKIYTHGSTLDLDFYEAGAGIDLNGFTISFTVESSVRNNGSFGNGARHVGNGHQYEITACFVEWFSIDNLTVADWQECYNLVAWQVPLLTGVKNCIGRLTTTQSNSVVFNSAGEQSFISCLADGGGIGFSGDSAEFSSCTSINASIEGFNHSNANGICTNNVSYNAPVGFFGTFAPGATNNASDQNDAVGTNPINLTENPFESDGHTPRPLGQLARAGTNLSIVTDAAGIPYDNPPSIGAFEASAILRTIGTAGDYVEINNWTDYVKALGSLTNSQLGLLIDDKNYTYSAQGDFNFSGNTLNGHTITLEAEKSVRHNGNFGTGARVEVASPTIGVYNVVENITLNDFLVTNLTSGSFNCYAFQNISNCTFNRVLAECKSTVINASPFQLTTANNTLNACVSKGGQTGFVVSTSSNLYGCTSLDAGISGFRASSHHNGVMQNCVSYGSGTYGFDDGTQTFAGTYSNNASDMPSDASLQDPRTITLTANPFEADGHTPTIGGQLDGAGVDLSIRLDASNTIFQPTPSIGAYEVNFISPYTIRVL